MIERANNKGPISLQQTDISLQERFSYKPNKASPLYNDRSNNTITVSLVGL